MGHCLLRHVLHVVDSFLTILDFLKQPLDDYLKKHYDGKVKVVRQKRREGLIRTRISGAVAATGQVLIFLDSHVEAGINWLPPLLGWLFSSSSFLDVNYFILSLYAYMQK